MEGQDRDDTECSDMGIPNDKLTRVYTASCSHDDSTLQISSLAPHSGTWKTTLHHTTCRHWPYLSSELCLWLVYQMHQEEPAGRK